MNQHEAKIKLSENSTLVQQGSFQPALSLLGGTPTLCMLSIRHSRQ